MEKKKSNAMKHVDISIIMNKDIFSKHGKFIIIEQLRNINITSTETLKLRLKERENFGSRNLKL